MKRIVRLYLLLIKRMTIALTIVTTLLSLIIFVFGAGPGFYILFVLYLLIPLSLIDNATMLFCAVTGIIDIQRISKREIYWFSTISEFLTIYLWLIISSQDFDFPIIAYFYTLPSYLLFFIIIGKAIKTVYPRLYDRVVYFRFLKITD